MNARDNHATSGSHYSATPGTLLCGRYEVVRQAGTGNFARVFECKDRTTGDHVAVKLLKKGYERDADFECDILRAINKHDTSNTANTVKLIDKSTYNGLAMIVFNLKGAPLRNAQLPFSLKDAAVLARDLGEALGFLHFSVRAVHTDLKPENVLADSPRSQHRWAICDLGSASFYSSRLDTDLITTRPYRAPEVVLGKGWSYPADTWSLGCILYEVRTGRKLFDSHTDNDHLSMMEQRLGALPGATRRYSTHVPSSARLALLVDELRAEDTDFVRLLLSMLAYDPSQRIRCSEIAKHPFVTKHLSQAAPSSRSSSACSTAAPSPADAALAAALAKLDIGRKADAPVPHTRPSAYATGPSTTPRVFGEIPRSAVNTHQVRTATTYALKHQPAPMSARGAPVTAYPAKPLISPAAPTTSTSSFKPRLGSYAF